MRLLNTRTLEVTEFNSDAIPEYAILSHTWGREEVTFQNIQSPETLKTKGFEKIKSFCKRAVEDGFDYCWIDTCCIDKTSSAELSEAINSMYQWYRKSSICYAYLEDVPDTTEYSDNQYGPVEKNPAPFEKSRWWSRGWTLQELIAPRIVEFYDRHWNDLGTKSSRCEEISNITGIDLRILQGAALSICNIAERMSWAAARQTTRIEDRAYSLMGIFEVNMPLLYGEGDRAFVRLQEEIMKVSEDYTLFAWPPQTEGPSWWTRGLLAESPSEFGRANEILSNGNWDYSDLLPSPSALISQWAVGAHRLIEHHPPSLTALGLRIGLLLARKPHSDSHYLACLTSLRRLPLTLLCVSLRKVPQSPHSYERIFASGFSYIIVEDDSLLHNDTYEFEYGTIYVTQPTPTDWRPRWLSINDLRDNPIGIVIVDMDNKQHDISGLSKLYNLWSGVAFSKEALASPTRDVGCTFSYIHDLLRSYEKRHSLAMESPSEQWRFWPAITLNRPLKHCWVLYGGDNDSIGVFGIMDKDDPEHQVFIIVGLRDGVPWCDIVSHDDVLRRAPHDDNGLLQDLRKDQFRAYGPLRYKYLILDHGRTQKALRAKTIRRQYIRKASGCMSGDRAAKLSRAAGSSLKLSVAFRRAARAKGGTGRFVLSISAETVELC